MNKIEFLATLMSERAKLEWLLKAIGMSRMDVAGVSGFYTTKDVIGHLMAYDHALVKWLKEAKAGRVYVDRVCENLRATGRPPMKCSCQELAKRRPTSG